MYNIRYHVASLVAVFLALTVGLLLGTIVAERGILDAQRIALVEGLQKDFRALSETNDLLSQQNENNAQFMSAVVPDLLTGRLQDKTVLVVTAAGQDEALYEVAASSISAAGGSPIQVILQREGLALEDTQTISALATLFPPGQEDIAGSVLTSLAAEWGGEGPRPVTQALLGLNAIGGPGLTRIAEIHAVVVLAAWEGGPDGVVLDLAEKVAARENPVLVAQVSNGDNGIVRAATERGLSAVDHLDSAEGAYSLVLVLSGRAHGHFGVLEGALGRFPAVPAM